MAQSGTKIAGVRETRKGATIYKTNERPGTRAQVRYVRVSAYKAREVLDLIRGKHVADADEILQFVERDIAIIIRKALASAVANAANNDGQDPEALFVSACYADEGPTLKRFRPRARGRAGRINKRTCHITVIVSRFSADELEAARAKQARRGTAPGAAASRSRRVAGSRKSGESAAPAAATPTDEAPLDQDSGTDAPATDEVLVDEVVASDAPVDEITDETVTDEVVDADEATEDDAATDASEEGDK